MKGLLYKEWCLGKKRLAPFVALAFMFGSMLVLMLLSMKFGNLKPLVAEDPGMRDIVIKIAFYVPYVLLLLGVEVALQSICIDYTTGWMHYSYTLPVPGKWAVMARYIFILLYMAVSGLIGILYSFLVGAVSGENYDFSIFKIQAGLGIVIAVYMSLLMPLTLRFKEKKKVDNVMGISILTLYILLIAFFAKDIREFAGSDDDGSLLLERVSGKLSDLLGGHMALYVIVAVLLIGLSFFWSVKVYQRREKG